MVLVPISDETDVLSRVSVRLLTEAERPEFDRLLTEKHYLQNCNLTGQTLRYVAELDGQWVALITFSAASLHLKAREGWIGWSARQRARRLPMVVNNSRFLVLPERQRYPNLASRVLALCLRRLSADWEQHWKHPVLVVESFVDESQYRGTCYRACGFEAVGPTQGFGRSSRDFYLPHGQPKQLYLRELRPGARRLLRQPRWPEELAVHETEVVGPCPFRASGLEGLLDRFATLTDSRRSHGLRHSQRFVLACAAVSTLMAACGYYASSLSLRESDDAEVAEIIRGHWPGIENGTHYRRDVTLGEDACRTANRQGAEVLASLRNLANGLYELEWARGRTKVDTLKSWCQQQTFSSAWPLLRR
jgi:hypothetical protein